MNSENYYISTGEQTKMYTLRVRYDELIGDNLVERDYHVRNLSIDADRAVSKAAALGYKVNHPEFELQEIRRRQDEAVLQAKRDHEERLRIRQEEKDQYGIDLVDKGLVPFGKFQGQKIVDMEPGYLEWAVQKADSFDAGVVIKYLAGWIKTNTKRVKLSNSVHIGAVKERMKGVKLRLIRTMNFEGFYGTTYIEIFATKKGNVVVYKGSAPSSLAVDESATFDFTIKAHEEYRGVNQTIVQRMKEHAE